MKLNMYVGGVGASFFAFGEGRMTPVLYIFCSGLLSLTACFQMGRTLPMEFAVWQQNVGQLIAWTIAIFCPYISGN